LYCHSNSTTEQKCNKNEEVTSGMDVACVFNIVDHSVHTRNICYSRVFVVGTAKHVTEWSQGNPVDQVYG